MSPINQEKLGAFHGGAGGSLSDEDRFAVDSTIAALEAQRAMLLEKQPETGQAAFALLTGALMNSL